MAEYVPRGYKIVLKPVRKDGPSVMIDCVDGLPPRFTYVGTAISVKGEPPLAAFIIAKIAELGGDLAKQYPDYDPDPKEI